MSYSGLGAMEYVIPSGGTFTGMFNVRGLPSGSAAAAASAIGAEVRNMRGVTFSYVGWGSGRDAGVVVANGRMSGDFQCGTGTGCQSLIRQLRDAATRARARIPGSVTIDTTVRHVPTVGHETAPPPPPPGTPPAEPDALPPQEPFYLQTVFGMPVWLLGVLGLGGIAIVLITSKKRAPAPVAAPAPALVKNRKRRRLRRNYSFSSWRGSRSSALPALRRVN